MPAVYFFYYDSLTGTSCKLIGIISVVETNNDIIIADAYSIVTDEDRVRQAQIEGSFKSILNVSLKEEFTGNSLAKVDPNNGLMVRLGDQLILEDSLDMSRSIVVDGNHYRIINKCKFGTL